MTDRPERIALSDVREAAERIAGLAQRTPVLSSRSLDERCGATVLLKAEHLQRTGSFKVRGAASRISPMTETERAGGVVAVSSGNHAGAVALVARHLDCRADIFMPSDAPVVKRAAADAYGARVHEYDRATDDRDELARAHLDAHGGTFIRPFDDPLVMAGQGTVALELLDEVGELDVLLVPMSGGGLMAGCATVAAALHPRCRRVGVEPAGADDTRRSLEAGERVSIGPPRTIADALALTTPGELTFPVNQRLVHEVVTVTEEAIAEATRFLLERTKQVVEPSGAVGVAALLSDRRRWRGRRVGVVLSGGNVDLATLATLAAG